LQGVCCASRRLWRESYHYRFLEETSPRFAAFVNGVSIHADDFDDTNSPAPKIACMAAGAPDSAVLPALLALPKTGRSLAKN